MPIDPGQRARARLLELERRRQLAVVSQFEKIKARLETEIADLLKRIEKQRLIDGNASPGLLLQKARFADMLDTVTDELNDASSRLAAITSNAQDDAIGVAQTQAAATPGLQTQLGFFDSGATRELIGVAGDGGPLDRVFARIAKPMRQSMFDALIQGVALGSSNATIAAEIRDAVGGGTAAAMTIVRTETNRAYREATRGYYSEVPGVRGWRWLAVLDLRTCPICWALHGHVFSTRTKFATHPNCRCTMIPVMIAEPHQLESGPDLFAKLNETQQRSILGPGRLELYKQGADLKHFVTKTGTPFGPGRALIPIADVKFTVNPRPPGIAPIPPSGRKGGGTPIARPAVTPSPALPTPAFTAEHARDMRTEFVAAVKDERDGFNTRKDELWARIKVLNEQLKAAIAETESSRPKWDDPASAEWFAMRRKINDSFSAKTSPLHDEIRGIRIAEKAAIAEARKRFHVPNPIAIDAVINKGKFSVAEKELVKTTIEEFNRLVDQDAWTSKIKRIGVNKRKGRAFYYQGQININPVEPDRRTIVHETGHAFEEINKDTVLKAANEFLDHRTKGELPVRLSKLLPGHRYRRDEIARPDKFKSPYVGKVYGTVGKQDYTEVISMGLEQLYADAYQFALEDPEYFDFILTIARGGLWQPLK